MNANTRNQNTNNRNQPTTTRNQPATTRTQPNPKSDKTERDDEKFWSEWWREYAQTWK
jgi:hypothetical protein